MSRRNAESPRSKLRMDDYPQSSRNGRTTRVRSPSRQRELDNVMKKARRGGSQSTYWNKKLLEVEEKDPNRWRHTGYKELYHEEKKSRSRSGSRSRSRSRSLSRSKSRSPSSKPRSPPARPRSPRSPPPKPRRRSPRSPRSTRSPRPRTPPKSRRPPSPSKARSESYSSDSASSCSDDSCSLCSPKPSRSNTKERPPIRRDQKRERPRDRERERERDRDKDRERRGDRARRKKRPSPRTSPTRPSRARSRSPTPENRAAPYKRKRKSSKQSKRNKEKTVLKVNRSHYIKVESESDTSEGSGAGASTAPRLSLSERFGRMAQWSADRNMEHRNLRITTGERPTVEMDSPPSPLYPPSLEDLRRPELVGSWDDVRARYAYYKERGYLRDLTLQDYVKWEQWWYKYQDWLEKERYYDRYGADRF